ncbi:MAG: hypothetical protein LBU32_20520 [Clostridiales bacterium]|jgi:hypothetical protein|nr:hypothetical protein [Clostridiales bacterium]
MESGSRRAAARGSGQGNPASPAIAGIYTRHALAQWLGVAFKRQCGGECGLAAYTGDFTAAFQYTGGAYHFPAASAERFALSGLGPGQARTGPTEFGKREAGRSLKLSIRAVANRGAAAEAKRKAAHGRAFRSRSKHFRWLARIFIAASIAENL